MPSLLVHTKKFIPKTVPVRNVMGRVVHGASCPWAKCPWVSCPWRELSVWRVVYGAGVVYGTKCLWGEMSRGEFDGVTFP
jgi:hypothetical protein